MRPIKRCDVPLFLAEQYPLDELMAALDNHMNDPNNCVQGALLSPLTQAKNGNGRIHYE